MNNKINRFSRNCVENIINTIDTLTLPFAEERTHQQLSAIDTSDSAIFSTEAEAPGTARVHETYAMVGGSVLTPISEILPVGDDARHD